MSKSHLSRRSNQRKSRYHRALIRDGLAAGKSLSAIAKENGLSYAHAKTLAAQESSRETDK